MPVLQVFMEFEQLSPSYVLEVEIGNLAKA
jgi:hypothetical protein